MMFSYFLRKQDLTFHANCLPPQYAWHVNPIFGENISKRLLLELLPSMLCLKGNGYTFRGGQGEGVGVGGGANLLKLFCLRSEQGFTMANFPIIEGHQSTGSISSDIFIRKKCHWRLEPV